MRDSPSAQWFHYTLWEDWHAGLYQPRLPNVALAEKVADLLRDCPAFGQAMLEVAEFWPVASTHNLTNEYRNHRPWLGRSAACFRYAAVIPDTNLAWSMLTPYEQLAANGAADSFCADWRSTNMPGQLRFAI